jgi:hypothetical protein
VISKTIVNDCKDPCQEPSNHDIDMVHSLLCQHLREHTQESPSIGKELCVENP